MAFWLQELNVFVITQDDFIIILLVCELKPWLLIRYAGNFLTSV